uniref:LOW QUALITY PROTEIN: protein ITPRID1 n=1 Tax=Jaculus jaculus TaxID=51337 RepID=UPI001E1B27AF|nr:LOW QUALITY PROTEIN: protein ITPRID1 [Jaculus jaculus]
MMAETLQGSDNSQAGMEQGKRGILRHTKRAWTPLDGHLLPSSEEESQSVTSHMHKDFKQESIQQWLDSGFFVHENLQQQGIKYHHVTLHEQGQVQMTVKDYMRSLHQFSGTPTLSRGTSFNSCHSSTSIPQSIPEWLEFWEKDPVEILLDLGFGVEEPDICTQIPARFLGCGSAARGINMSVFLDAQKQRMDIENPDLYGRFRQLEILDHVTNAFSSLLNDINTLQCQTEKKAGEQSRQSTSVSGVSQHQKRRLLRRASRQVIRRDLNPDTSESFTENRFSTLPANPWECGVQLPVASVNNTHSPVTHWEEHESIKACYDLIPCHPPQALLGKQWLCSSILAKHPPHTCVSEVSGRNRTWKENWIHMNKLENLTHLTHKGPDSFEMEEVQSFEEDMCNSSDVTSGIAGTRVYRTNSCQSDSSGFLEELPEPLPLQISSSPGSQSPTEGRGRKPRDWSHSPVSFQEFQQESNDSDSKSVVSASLPSQDRRILEEQESMLVEAPQFEATEGTPEMFNLVMVLKENNRDAEEDAEYEAIGGIVPSTYTNPLGFVVTPVTVEKNRSLKHEGAGEVLMQRYHFKSQRSSGIDQTPDKFPHVDTEVPGTEGNSQLCSDTSYDLLARQRPQQHITRNRGAMPYKDNLVQNSDQSIPCLDKLPGDVSTDSNAASSRSVMSQMSSNLVSAAKSDYRGTVLECTPCDPITATVVRPWAEEKQVNDISVQTHAWESQACHRRSPSHSKVFTHRHRPLTKSVSLDRGFPSTYPTGICHIKSSHYYCHHCPHYQGERQSPGLAPSIHGHCPCPHAEHPEASFMKSLKVLQDTMRELCSCTVRDMEAMKTVCQSFQKHLEEIEQHLKGQQAFYLRDISEEEREEAKQLQALREALRQQVAELAFQLGDRAWQIREGILQQLELLAGKPSGYYTNLQQHDWEGRGYVQSLCTQNLSVVPESSFPPTMNEQDPCSEETQLAALTPPSLGTTIRISPLLPVKTDSH